MTEKMVKQLELQIKRNQKMTDKIEKYKERIEKNKQRVGILISKVCQRQYGTRWEKCYDKYISYYEKAFEKRIQFYKARLNIWIENEDADLLINYLEEIKTLIEIHRK